MNYRNVLIYLDDDQKDYHFFGSPYGYLTLQEAKDTVDACLADENWKHVYNIN